MKFHKFKLIDTPCNPQYRPNIEWFEIKEHAEARKAEIDTKTHLGVVEVKEINITIPDALFNFIKKTLADRSEQFSSMNFNHQVEEIDMCYRQMMCALDNFNDGRYAY